MKMLEMSDDKKAIAGLAGKKVMFAWEGTNENGYPCVQIEFMDGTVLEILEEGQCGSLSVSCSLVTDPVCTCDYVHHWHRDWCPVAIEE